LADKGLISYPFNPNATKEDIYYCFRLILGRNPGPHEWPAHSASVGSELASVVRTYVRSQEFHGRRLLAREVPQDIHLAELADFRIYASEANAIIGRAVLRGEYEPEVTAVFRRHLRSGMGVIDIGANIGYFTMLSAAITGPGGYVLAVEPNPHNVTLLEASRRANSFDWVTVLLSAAGRETGVIALWATDSNGTAGAIQGGIEELNSATLVPCVQVDKIVDPDRRIDLIKIDVEGAEAAALEGARRTLERWKPLVISEFSPEAIPGMSGISAEDYLRFLGSVRT
jgi:FkbM family methyltransferase